MIVLAVVALLTSVGGSLVAHTQYNWLSTQASSLKKTSGQPSGESDGDGDGGENANVPVEFGSFYEVQNMIVNPAGSQGSRYLMVNLGFESDEEAVITELEDKEVVVRDKVIKMLSEFTVPELANIDRRDSIKDTLRTSVNQVLQEGQVTRLYFTQYVLQ